MLTEAFPQLQESKAVLLLRAYFRSAWHPVVVAFLMACSELFSWELPVFYLYLCIGIVAVLFDEDTLALAPVMLCCYMTISAPNNVGKHSQTVFSDPSFQVQFIFILATAAIFLAARLVSVFIQKPKKESPAFTFGFAVLGLSYVLAGAFSGFYGGRTVLFGFAQIAALCFCYFYFYYTVDWKRVPKEYIMAVFFAVGVALIVEIAGMYAASGVFTENGVNRTALYTGWGIYNNVGCAMAMCLPAPFYFAVKCRQGWVFTVIGTVFLLAVMLTQSRTSMLFGGVVYAFCAVAVIVLTRGWERYKHLIVFASIVFAFGMCAVVFKDKLASLFDSLLKIGLNPWGRLKIWRACWEKFLQAPAFGVGFYETPGGLLHGGGIVDLAPCPPDAFIPPRAHNTYVQLLASGGSFALISYLVHRAETVVLLFRRPTKEKTFIALSILALILTSLFDCHFFNFGPGIMYGFLLAFAEGDDIKSAGARGSRRSRSPSEQGKSYKRLP